MEQQANELRQLRADLRQDVQGLHLKFDANVLRIHEKLDKLNTDNNLQHVKLMEKIAEVDKKSEVKTAVLMTKIGVVVAGISLFVSSVFAWIVEHVTTGG